MINKIKTGDKVRFRQELVPEPQPKFANIKKGDCKIKVIKKALKDLLDSL